MEETDFKQIDGIPQIKSIIKIIGVGGGGVNAVNYMYRKGINDVTFALCNTGRQALNDSPIPIKIHMGFDRLDAFSPKRCRQDAEESEFELHSMLKDGTKMSLIVAGMGGAIGTGAAPVIARISKELEILTIGIVTLPFKFEGFKRSDHAIEGIEEMAKCAIPYGFTDSKACFEDVVQRILAFRSDGDKSLPSDFIDTHQPSRGSVNLAHPYSHLLDIANTMVNWMEYTQLAARNDSGLLSILPGKDRDIKKIISAEWPFITLDSAENYQRRYGLDPDHRKDTRNLLETKSISSLQIDSQRVKSIFLAYAASKPVPEITKEACDYVAERAGVSYQTASDVLMKTYPHGAVGGFMANYYEMAFQGREHAVDFELATTNVFQDVFGYKAQHLGQTGSLSAPDVLLLSDEEDSYQAVIDCKAYSEYSISGDHHNRMVHNYVEGIDRYSPYKCRIGFFLYVSGGFGASIDKQLKEEADDCGHHGSGITVMNLIKMVQRHEKDPYSHADLERIFSVDRQVRSFDYLQYTVYVNG